MSIRLYYVGMSILVSPQELQQSIHHGDRLTLLASLWQPVEGESYNQFSSMHIPTAQYSDAAQAFVGLPGSKVGSNPLPDPDKLQNWFEKWGLRSNRPVVVYDEGRGVFAGRAWWTLRWAGVEDVRILNGGLKYWAHLGFETLTGPGNLVVNTDAEVRPGSMPTATLEEAREYSENGGLLIDTRTRNRFSGRRENLDLKAGHIPGAVNVPERFFHHDGIRTLKSREENLQVLADAGLTPENVKDAIIYSGSGNHSALALAVLEDAGFHGLRHFVGGWSQWSADPANPVERGDRFRVGE